VTGLNRLCFIGVGAMGTAMIEGVLGARLLAADRIVVADNSADRRDRAARLGVETMPVDSAALRDADLIIVAVKPGVVPSVLGALRDILAPNQAIVSIAAGVTLTRLSDLSGHAAIVRAMPNTPARIGAGVTVWTATSSVDPTARAHTAAVLGVLGKAVEVDDEKYLDMATALSASGTGFVFLFLEALIDAGVHIGLPRPLAVALATETLAGAGAMARGTDTHPAILRYAVTSPGGTTAAGLAALEAGGFRAAIDAAIVAAHQRSQSLGR
jgi:pyrroline-5-carboxylate reductase